jgi:hypothetical protein
LKDEDLKQQYQREIQSKLEEEEEGESIEEEWKRIEEVVKKTAEEKLGEKRLVRNEWFDQECREVIDEKNKAREKIIKRETRGNCEKYKQLRLKANRICKRKKRERLKEEIEEIEILNQGSDIKKFYSAMDRIRKEFYPRERRCRDKHGKMLGEEKVILDRWAEHFSDLLNKSTVPGNGQLDCSNPSNGQLDCSNPSNGQLDCSNPSNEQTVENLIKPTRQEIAEVIKKMKNNKVPGEDGILAEMIKYGGEELENATHRLIHSIWDEETMPESWKMGMICPIYKKR